MKRSRRVVLTMMGSAAAGAVSMGWVGAPNCGRNEELVAGPNGGRPFPADGPAFAEFMLDHTLRALGVEGA